LTQRLEKGYTFHAAPEEKIFDAQRCNQPRISASKRYMELRTDDYYIERLLNGETECFASIVDRYSKQVFSLIVRIVGNREDAEELTQDVFLKVFKSLPSFQGESAFSTWLYRIAYNHAVSATRKQKRGELAYIEENALPEIADDDSDDGSWEEDLHNARLECLQEALKQLSGADDALITMFYKDNLPVNEIASITGMSEANVKTRLFRLRKKLLMIIKEKEAHI
jgi:RNA polymerase sigma-70 factor (ECF subfamily)